MPTTDYERELAMASSQDRGAVLLGILDRPSLTDIERAYLIDQNWTTCEAWGDDLPAIIGQIKRLTAKGCQIGSPIPTTPDEIFTIYRATATTDPPSDGSWTLDVKVAQAFARMIASPRALILSPGMYSPNPVIWKATVHRGNVLAYFTDRNEDELVVVSPDGVEAYQQLQAVTVASTSKDSA